ncbi:MAG: zinc ribbon domain-containing protein [Clostridia bacterium]|nr:zinc ribbon domain-containing protein [Clostridia bacterium]
MTNPDFSPDNKNDNKDVSDKNKKTPPSSRKPSLGDRTVSLKFGCSAIFLIMIVVYVIVVAPTVFSHYFSDLDPQSIMLTIFVILILVVVAFIGAILSHSPDAKKPEIDEFTHVSNEYKILKEYAEKKHTNTSVDADSGRCSECGAKVSRTNTNCPKCGRIIR